MSPWKNGASEHGASKLLPQILISEHGASKLLPQKYISGHGASKLFPQKMRFRTAEYT